MRGLILVLPLALSTTVAAQSQMRPTDAPLVNASNESWYQRRDPVQFLGDLFFPAGAAVFFNGNVMVRTGSYNDVPLYADTTLEPDSIIFVPIGRGLLQPYERRRRGDLAGTTGSRAPSFPVRLLPDAATAAVAAPPAVATILPAGAAIAPNAPAAPAAAAVDTTASVAAARPISVATLLRPQNNDGLSVRFENQTWVSRGEGVALDAAAFVRIGDYAGFPVFKKRDVTEDVIYLPTRAGVIAPYRRKM